MERGENLSMGVLAGIRVLDLSRFQSGPVAGMLMGDMGAEVIRIEEPGGASDRSWGLLGPDGETLSYKIVGRNRKGVTLRLNRPEGERIFSELVRKSDVVLHNATPGTSMAAQLSYERLSAMHPPIIVAAITGFGQEGPDAQHVCFDHIAQGRSGAMMLTGFPGDPPLKTTVTHNDLGAGAYAALGIVTALYHREKTGQGQFIDVSLLDVAFFSAQCMGALLLYRQYGEIRTQVGNRGFHSYVCCVKALDGWIVISGTTNAIWARLMRAIGRDDMATDERFCANDMVRFDRADEIDRVMQDWVGHKTAREAIDILQAARVPCGLVQTIDQTEKDPQIGARRMVVDLEYPGLGALPVPNLPFRLSRTPGDVSSPAPAVGQDNEEIYGGLLGLTAEELAALKEADII